VCVQVEDKKAIPNIESIAGVEGVDVLFVGPSDLSQSLGYPGAADNPVVQEAMQHAFATIIKSGKSAGTAGNFEMAATRLRQGITYYCVHLTTLLSYGYSELYPYMSLGDGLYRRQKMLKSQYGVEWTVTEICSCREAQANPCMWGTSGAVVNGRVISYVTGAGRSFQRSLEKDGHIALGTGALGRSPDKAGPNWAKDAIVLTVPAGPLRLRAQKPAQASPTWKSTQPALLTGGALLDMSWASLPPAAYSMSTAPYISISLLYL
jgi:hypothetical protein